mgnify:CR=1 FL=1
MSSAKQRIKIGKLYKWKWSAKDEEEYPTQLCIILKRITRKHFGRHSYVTYFAYLQESCVEFEVHDEELNNITKSPFRSRKKIRGT